MTTATPLHILLQFSENPNERFLFPKQSILEFNSTLTEVTCSFLAIRTIKAENDKDSAINMGDGSAGAAAELKEVWAPVTVTFKGDAPTLSVLGRVAEPVDVARRGMEDVICRGVRGEEGYLALRLPTEPVAVDGSGAG